LIPDKNGQNVENWLLLEIKPTVDLVGLLVPLNLSMIDNVSMMVLQPNYQLLILLDVADSYNVSQWDVMVDKLPHLGHGSNLLV